MQSEPHPKRCLAQRCAFCHCRRLGTEAPRLGHLPLRRGRGAHPQAESAEDIARVRVGAHASCDEVHAVANHSFSQDQLFWHVDTGAQQLSTESLSEVQVEVLEGGAQQIVLQACPPHMQEKCAAQLCRQDVKKFFIIPSLPALPLLQKLLDAQSHLHGNVVLLHKQGGAAHKTALAHPHFTKMVHHCCELPHQECKHDNRSPELNDCKQAFPRRGEDRIKVDAPLELA
mmetsp:Transcript_102340/g.330133  ORF Transcript_102340/g.330133 Transcript_102340/m.330133 type:complete len:229 (+) Transcript_102340:71-757(+)